MFIDNEKLNNCIIFIFLMSILHIHFLLPKMKSKIPLLSHCTSNNNFWLVGASNLFDFGDSVFTLAGFTAASWWPGSHPIFTGKNHSFLYIYKTRKLSILYRQPPENLSTFSAIKTDIFVSYVNDWKSQLPSIEFSGFNWTKRHKIQTTGMLSGFRNNSKTREPDIKAFSDWNFFLCDCV